MNNSFFEYKNIKTLQLINAAIPTDAGEKRYVEFLVSGVPLRNILDASHSQLTPFGWGKNKDYEKETLHIFTLRKKPRLETGRVMIYVCSACGDFDCGAITAYILDAGTHIVWKDFGYETGYGGVSELFENIEPIVFTRQNYFEAFSKLK